MEDRQAALIGGDAIRLFDVDTGEEIAPAVTEVEWEAAATELSGYPGLHDQGDPRAARRAPSGSAPAGRPQAQRLAAMIDGARDVFVVGCGTASHAALAAQYLLARIAGRRVTFATGSEFSYLGDFVAEGSLVLAFSQSGETIDVHRLGARGPARAARGSPRSSTWRAPRSGASPTTRCRSGPDRSAACSPPRASPPSWPSC